MHGSMHCLVGLMVAKVAAHKLRELPIPKSIQTNVRWYKDELTK